MGVTAFDSFYLRDRYGSAAMRAIWDDRATIQRWLDVEAGARRGPGRARPACPEAGRAREIAREARVELLDLRTMKREFDRTWNPVMPLVDALRARAAAAGRGLRPLGRHQQEHHRHRHRAADPGDSYAVVLAELDALEAALARLAAAPPRHRDGRAHPRPARAARHLRLQGARCWLDELMRQRERLVASRPRVLVGEFGGAVGTLAALGRKRPARAAPAA